MPRPARIEFENAVYHVMNRGRGKQFIFHDSRYYRAYLKTLGEACERFGCIIHAYCLMGNHYHLLLETPLTNLSRVMRHINGVYTQRHNWLKETDGPLFRGRYKSILISQDNFLLQVSRYIHRNPIETELPLVQRLEHYQWSSYPAYLGLAQVPQWLDMSLTQSLLRTDNPIESYREYVMQGSDDETITFHKKGNTGAVFGSDDFKSWVFDELLPPIQSERKTRIIRPNLSLEAVGKAVSHFYHVSIDSIRQCARGKQAENEPRKVAMYLSQQTTGASLREIAKFFNLKQHRCVCYATCQVRLRLCEDKHFELKLQRICKMLRQQPS